MFIYLRHKPAANGNNHQWLLPYAIYPADLTPLASLITCGKNRKYEIHHYVCSFLQPSHNSILLEPDILKLE